MNNNFRNCATGILFGVFVFCLPCVVVQAESWWRGPNYEFTGWSKDGSQFAFKIEDGFSDEDPKHREDQWVLSCFVVEQLSPRKKIGTYQIKKMGNPKYYSHATWELFHKGQALDDWERVKNKMGLVKSQSGHISPSSFWTLAVRISENLDRKIETKKIIEGDEDSDGPTGALEFHIRAVNKNSPSLWEKNYPCVLLIGVEGGGRFISIESMTLKSGPTGISPPYGGGALSAYWSPFEVGVAIEWMQYPLAGGAHPVSLLVGSLPKKDKVQK